MLITQDHSWIFLILPTTFIFQATVATSSQGTKKSSKLQSEAVKEFLDAVEIAQPDLRWIQDMATELRQSKRIVRHDTYKSPFEYFEPNLPNDDSYLQFLDTGDSWYKTFREKECGVSKNDHGYCYSSTPLVLDPWTENPVTNFPVQNFDHLLNNDFYMRNKNTQDLYEEAEFEKLSKFEQEESEPDALSSLDKKVQTVRHVFNPQSEIKLKISNKFMNRGLSAVLPSGIYERESSDPLLKYKSVSVEKNIDSDQSVKMLPNFDVFKRNHDLTEDFGGEEFRNVGLDELKSEYEDIVDEFKRETDENKAETNPNLEQKPAEENSLHSFSARKILSVKADFKNDADKISKVEKFLHLKNLENSTQDVYVEMHKPGNNSTLPEKSAEKNPQISQSSKSLNLTVTLKMTPQIPRVRQKRFRKKFSAQDDAYSYEDFVSGKAITQIIEKIYEGITKDPAKEKWFSQLLPPKRETLDTISQIGEYEINEKKKSHHRDDKVRNLANKIEHLVEDEVQGTSCVTLSPQLQEYLNRLMEASEYQPSIESPRHAHLENHFDAEFDDEYEDYHYFDEPSRLKRRVPVISTDELRCKYETLHTLIHKYNELSIQEKQELQTVREMLSRHQRLLDEIKEITTKSDQVVENIVKPKVNPYLDEKKAPLKLGTTIESDAKQRVDDANSSKIKQQQLQQDFKEKTNQFERLEKAVNFIHRNIKD